MKEAMFYEKLPEKKVRCVLCRFRCIINEGSRGICGVRENRGGVLYSLVYGVLCAEHIDPIEKKPLFHFHPGSSTYSIATVGCNFHCLHCQNYTISQVSSGQPIHGYQRSPQHVVDTALSGRCRSISYTYTEPTIFYEFALETARLARENQLSNIFVTNGYISKDALREISPILDAANIDLKGYSNEFYRDVVHASLPEVLDSIIEYRRLGVWLELTTLIIPGLNDSDSELKGISSFIVNNLGADVPWHVSQFYPTYKMTDRPKTPASTLQRARDIGESSGLKYVYIGNIPGGEGESTRCQQCKHIVIERTGFTVTSNRTVNGNCPKCGSVIAGVGI